MANEGFRWLWIRCVLYNAIEIYFALEFRYAFISRHIKIDCVYTFG